MEAIHTHQPSEGLHQKNHASFIETLRSAGFSDEDIETIDAAYDIAKYGHRLDSRDGGERYFEHVRSVALLLIDVGVRDADIIASCLLHDTVEDTGILGSKAVPGRDPHKVAANRLDKFFSPRVKTFVMAVTKRPGEDPQRYIQRITRAGAEAVLIKLADRLHNITTIGARPEDKQRSKIAETETLYMPIFRMFAASAGAYQQEATALLTRLDDALLAAKRSLAAH